MRLLRNGHAVAVIDEMNDYYDPALKWSNLQELKTSGLAAFYQADICDVEPVMAAFLQFEPELVIHLAARAGVRPSQLQPVDYVRTNVHGTTVILEAVRRHKVRRLLFASSSSVYGIANQVPFREDDNVQAASVYAATKIAGEKLCQCYSHLYGFSVACLRFFTVYGPRQRPDLAIRKFTQNILAGRPVVLFGDGSSGRDYTYVEDIVDGVIASAELDSPFDVFNLGDSHVITLREMVRTIEQASGRKACIEYGPPQAGDVPITCASIDRAAKHLNYRPQISFQEGIRRFVAWFQETPAKARAASV
jgi:UDP-glucuronate 4-epimerase